VTTVVLDTNALMMPVEVDVRVFDELDRLLGSYECVAPRAVRDELADLAEGSGTEATAATVGLDLLDEHCKLRETELTYADDAVVELTARTEVTHVVTNDRPLQQRLLDAGVLVISLRGQNKLAITRP
jgi:rRNA-processing protein FCF1